MATFRGIAAIGTGVLALLEDAWSRDPFVTDAMETAVVSADGLRERPFDFGVTVFVYRVAVNGTQRTVPPTVPGRRRPLPVEVDLLLSTWGRSAERELELLGWCMRVLDDDPLLSGSVLNRAVPEVFSAGELVEVAPNPLPLDDHYRLWDALAWDYQTSAAYTARVVRLESAREVTEAGPVLERDLELARAGERRMSIRVLEHVVRRAGLAVRLTDLATGLPVRDGITVTAWPEDRPDLAVGTRSVSGAGVAGFTQLPGIRTYEDGSTPRASWFASPVIFPPAPFVVRVDDATGEHLTVVREVLVPGATPVEIALPRSPSASTPSGSLTVVADVVTQTGAPASWAVVELSIGSFICGGVADERGTVLIPVPRAVAPSSNGTPAGGPIWRLDARVRHRPADQVVAPGTSTGDPPTITSLLSQSFALVDDGGPLVGSIERDLTTEGPLVLVSLPAPEPSVLVIRPTP